MSNFAEICSKRIGKVKTVPYKTTQSECEIAQVNSEEVRWLCRAHTHQSGWICVPANAAEAVGAICSHTATSELGFFAASSCAIGTK